MTGPVRLHCRTCGVEWDSRVGTVCFPCGEDGTVDE